MCFIFVFLHLILDRDTYLTVNFENINCPSQYQKCQGTECRTFDTPYDCSSIMHYRDYFCQKSNDVKTMTPKNANSCNLGVGHTQKRPGMLY